MQSFLQDLRYGTRMLRKHPGFTVLAVITIALGIGANSMIFSIINAVLLRPLTFREPAQLVRIWETMPQGGNATVSIPNLKDWREQNEVFSQIAGYNQYLSCNLQGPDGPHHVTCAWVTPEFFEVFGVPPLLGRTFNVGEDYPGNHRVAVLSERLRQRYFSADPQIVGKSVPINGESYLVVGVMPPAFRFPEQSTDLWIPVSLSAEAAGKRENRRLSAIARLRPGVTVDQAQAQMSFIARRLERQYPHENAGWGVLLLPLQETMVKNTRPALLVLFGAAGFVLLIGCANSANLLLARATTRRREIAVRLALGAGLRRLMRQLLTEGLLLSTMGGILGLISAQVGITVFLKGFAQILPRAGEVNLDWRVVGFTLLVSLFTGITVGVVPAIQSTKFDLQTTLRVGGTAGDGPSSNRLRSLLVVVEVAAAFILLIGVGLAIKTFLNLRRVDPGIQAENVLTMNLKLPEVVYRENSSSAQFFQQLLERIAVLPGVEAAGVINLLPLQQTGTNVDFQVEGQPFLLPGKLPRAEVRTVSPDYFRALGIPLIRGRFPNNNDTERSELVILINQTFAQRYFPDQDPIDKHVWLDYRREWAAVVGVVGDVKQSGLTRPVREEMYFPYTQQRTSDLMSLVVRASSDPTSLTGAIRREVQTVDPSIPIYNLKTMKTVIAESIMDRRLNLVLLGFYGALALALAIIGVYGVISYTVTQSTRELGIRMALGAQQKDIFVLIVGHGLVLATFGIVCGIGGAMMMTRLMNTLLYGVGPTDPSTFMAMSAVMIAVTFLACVIPARRAVRVDPISALRCE
jgi:putative ABC transport system permease protein